MFTAFLFPILLSAQITDPTYHRDVQPLLAEHCLVCHSVDGVAAAYAMDTPEKAQALASSMADAVENGRMPPWAPDGTCSTFKGERSLNDAEKAIFSSWSATNAPLGEVQAPTDVAQRVELTGDVKTIFPVESYSPDVSKTDDYRCFVLDESFTEETFVTGYDFSPGATALVHHAAVFLVPAAYRDALAELEAAAPAQEGYPCFGSPGIDFVEYFGGWVPGTSAVRFPDDSAYVIPPGSKVVMQVHYNMAAGFTTPDLTGFRFLTRDDPPEMRVRQKPIVHLNLNIEADDEKSVQENTTIQEDIAPWKVIGVLPHMHLLGKRIQLSTTNASGDERCMLDVKEWDFELQESFFFEEPFDVAVGDTLDLRCTFDNSAANQPLVNGARQDPADVAWGEGTTDEMCVVVIMALIPYGARAEGACVIEGEEGNEVGVGRFCTDTGSQCEGLDANFCLASAVADMPFCTKIFCADDDECGEGATCEGDATGSACILTKCLGDDDGEQSCGCDVATSSTNANAWFLLLGLLPFFRRQPRRSS